MDLHPRKKTPCCCNESSSCLHNQHHVSSFIFWCFFPCNQRILIKSQGKKSPEALVAWGIEPSMDLTQWPWKPDKGPAQRGAWLYRNQLKKSCWKNWRGLLTYKSGDRIGGLFNGNHIICIYIYKYINGNMNERDPDLMSLSSLEWLWT